jgi:N-acetylglucosamine kinase-like BadF-type ATPase
MDRVATPAAVRHEAQSKSVCVGADVGGTWIRIAVWVNGRRGPTTAVPADRNLKELASALRAVWRRRRWDRQRVASLVVASRGLWTVDERHALARSLRGYARRVQVISDAQAALLGALGERPGVLLLSGTGSIVVGRDAQSRWSRAGGLGPLVGDEGSGFWLGREWLRMAARDGRLLSTLRAVHAADPVKTIAALAPHVIARARRGDRRALRIVREGQRHLAARALEVARALRLPQPVDASWAGRVLANPWFRAGTIRAVARAGLRVRWHRPAEEPVVAAARLAAARADA